MILNRGPRQQLVSQCFVIENSKSKHGCNCYGHIIHIFSQLLASMINAMQIQPRSWQQPQFKTLVAILHFHPRSLANFEMSEKYVISSLSLFLSLPFLPHPWKAPTLPAKLLIFLSPPILFAPCFFCCLPCFFIFHFHLHMQIVPHITSMSYLVSCAS